MKKQTFLSRLLTGGRAIVLATMLVFSGCGMDGTNPMSSDTGTIASEAETPGVLAKKKNNDNTSDTAPSTDTSSDQTSSVQEDSNPPEPIILSQLIMADEGGYMAIKTDDDVYKYSLTFPPDALEKNTKITMIVPDPGKSMVVLQPHGIQFNESVHLKMEIYTDREVKILDPDPGKKNKLDIYYFNEVSEAWEGLGGEMEIERKKKKIKGEVGLKHFSRYGLGGDYPIQKFLYQQGMFYY